MKKVIATSCFLLLSLSFSSAQSNEVSLSLGANATSNQNFVTTVPFACTITDPTCNTLTGHNSSATAFTAGGNYARRLTRLGPASLYAEFPVVGVPDHNVNLVFDPSGQVNPFASTSSSSHLVFFTPSARFQFLPSAAIAPWASVGGGLAHVSLANNGRNTGALQFGGGLDFKTPFPHLALRTEVRDFWSGGNIRNVSLPPLISTTADPNHQHHIFVGGGVVFKF
jgi:hypothetical protein